MDRRIIIFVIICIIVGRPCAVSRSKRQAAECIPRGDALTTSMCDRVIPIPDEIKQEFSLDPFYHNYTNAYGIPILSSGAVSLAAMQRACYTVRFMLADREDVRNAVHNNCARVSIIGLNELTNQIPEYSYFDDSENQRARGIGGTLNNPVSTVGEENLLCLGYQQDRWFREDIGLHEFAHAIEKIGMNTVVSGFSSRLRTAYKEAVNVGLWASTYAGSSAQEYYAEGVQKFFEVDVVQEYTDGIHNNISNRMELLEYDPQLYSFVLETFPCANHIVPRCEDQALIATQPLMMNCYSEMMGTMDTTKEVTAEVATESDEPSTNVISTIITTMRREPKTPTVTETSTENGEPSTNVISTITTTMRTEPKTPLVIESSSPRSCDALPTIPFGKLDSSISGTLYTPETVPFVCDNGYSSSEDSVTCMEDGSWTPAECRPIGEESKLNITGIICGIAVFFVLLVIANVLFQRYRVNHLNKLLSQNITHTYEDTELELRLHNHEYATAIHPHDTNILYQRGDDGSYLTPSSNANQVYDTIPE